MPSDPYTHAIARLSDLGPQRAWSLVVTIFGDMAQDQSIAGPTLSGLMADMNVKSEALRVALHRLRADGWITSEKQGRTSRHSLSDKGRSESRVATPKIYRRPEDMPKGWHLILLPDTNAPSDAVLAMRGYQRVENRLYIGSDLATSPDCAIVLNPQNAQGWLPKTLYDDALAQEYNALHAALVDVQALLADLTNPSPNQIAVLRCLIVHNWRRLVLKHPALPSDIYPPSHKGAACRALVTDLLDALPRPVLA